MERVACGHFVTTCPQMTGAPDLSKARLFLPVLLSCIPPAFPAQCGRLGAGDWGHGKRTEAQKATVFWTQHVNGRPPPGAGKTLLARAVPSILPRMTFDE
jgi:hypothetical protein